MKKEVKTEEPKEIYYGTAEAKAMPSFRGIRIKSKEECDSVNR